MRVSIWRWQQPSDAFSIGQKVCVSMVAERINKSDCSRGVSAECDKKRVSHGMVDVRDFVL